jgi:hypothetical protein
VQGFISDSSLAHALIRIGDEAIACEDEPKLRDYFAQDYVFHGPGGDLAFEEVRAYFASLRSAFSGLRIVREHTLLKATSSRRGPGSRAISPTCSRIHPSARRTHRQPHRMGSNRHFQVRR